MIRFVFLHTKFHDLFIKITIPIGLSTENQQRLILCVDMWLLLMTQSITDEDILREVTEIGCMCTNCNCKKTVPTVVPICDSCLKNMHNQNSIYN